ncbi:MAG: hypothetical protein DRH37_02910 [Deltaproteobacteria bacterium]|nr:MAG: hypothetical protein DRH37_02910 [Deltaproteobacteria bacterium]
MLYILIIGIGMAILSSIFWCLESLPFVRCMRKLEGPKGPISAIKYAFNVLGALPKLTPLGIDLFATVWLVGSFGFSGLLGGVIGITVSNVISIFIIAVSKSKKMKDGNTYQHSLII